MIFALNLHNPLVILMVKYLGKLGRLFVVLFLENRTLGRLAVITTILRYN